MNWVPQPPKRVKCSYLTQNNTNLRLATDFREKEVEFREVLSAAVPDW